MYKSQIARENLRTQIERKIPGENATIPIKIGEEQIYKKIGSKWNCRVDGVSQTDTRLGDKSQSKLSQITDCVWIEQCAKSAKIIWPRNSWLYRKVALFPAQFFRNKAENVI